MTQGEAGRDRDAEKLAELGYKQELSRAWSGFSNFAISFTIISVLAGCFTVYGQAWNNGGPIAISWGWPIICRIILILALSLAEPASAYPTAGRPHWWAGKPGGAGRAGVPRPGGPPAPPGGRAGLVVVHRLGERARPRGGRRVGRLRRRDVRLGAAEPVERRPRRHQLRRRRLARRDLRRLRADPDPARAGEHLLVPVCRAVQQ